MKDKIKIMLRESINKTDVTKIAIFDFDGTLVNSPTPDNGKIEFEKKTGKKWPFEGWWGKADSLDQSVFDMPVVPETITAYNQEKTNPDTLMVMMTGRMMKLSPYVRNILDAKGLKFDVYEYNNGGNTLDSKIKSLDRLLAEYPNVKSIHLWDDRIGHIESFKAWGASKTDLKFDITLINGSHH